MRQNAIRGVDHRTVCRSTAKKEKMTPSDHTHSHTQRTFCVDFIDRFVEKAEINTYFPAECRNQNLVQKKLRNMNFMMAKVHERKSGAS